MNTRIVVAILSCILLQINVYGQCNDDLVKVAMSQSGKDAMFIREFRANLKKGTVRNPVPSAKYNVYLKVGSIYRYNIVTEKSTNSQAILQLFNDGKCVGSTYNNVTNQSEKTFDFQSPVTGSYQVVISFMEGKAGCVAGVMSLIEKRGEQKSDSVLSEKSAEMETLYLNVENALSILTDNEPSDTMLLQIDNGVVIQKTDSYYIRPEKEGLATLKVIVKDKDGRVKDEARSDFLVRRLPTPTANIQGIQGGLISRSSIQLAETLNIDFPVDYEKYGYKIVDFEVKIGTTDEKRLLNNGKKFSTNLKGLLDYLPEESRLIFESIHVRTPGGQIITIEPIAFVVR